MRVSEIAERIALSSSATSQHLGRLREAGLVLSRRQSQEIFYSISTPQVMEVIKSAEYLVGMRDLTPSSPYSRKWA
jgi:DNA-binding transcriptional ArsR family regulator